MRFSLLLLPVTALVMLLGLPAQVSKPPQKAGTAAEPAAKSNQSGKSKTSAPKERKKFGSGGFMQNLVNAAKKVGVAIRPGQKARGEGIAYGSVVDGDGQAIAGARIILGSADSLQTITAFTKPLALTDALGRYELRLVAPADAAETKNRAYLLVVAEGRLALRVKLPSLSYTGESSWRTAANLAERRAEQGLDLLARLWGRATPRPRPGTDLKQQVLRRGVSLRGRIVDSVGKPVAAARVTAQDLLTQRQYQGVTKQGTHYSYATTAADGTFDLPGVFSTGSSISIEKAGFYRTSLPVVGGGKPVELRIRRSARVVGRVLGLDGKPASGSLRIAYEVSATNHSEAIDKAGRFDFELKYPHRYRLSVNPSGGSTKDHGKTYSPILSGGQDALVIKLWPKPPKKTSKKPKPKPERKSDRLGFPVSVVDLHTRRPLQKFKAGTVWVSSYNASNEPYMISRGRSMTKSNLQPGYIRVQPPRLANQLSGAVVVQADGYAIHLTTIEWEDGRTPRIEVEMIPESILSGVVRDDKAGAVISGARVKCYSHSSDRSQSQSISKVTGKDGRFIFDGLGAGYYRLSVSHKNRPANTHQVDLLAEEKRADLDFLVRRGAEVSGRITGIVIGDKWQVELLTTAELRSMVSNPGSRTASLHVTLGRDGRFKFAEVRPGYYEVTLRVPQDPRRGSDLQIPIEPIRVRDRTMNLVLDAGADLPGEIRGKVRVVGAKIDPARMMVLVGGVVAQNPWSYSYRTSINLAGSRCQVAADGRFSLTVAMGTHKLSVIDVLTGVTLLDLATTVDIDSGAVVVRDLEVRLAAVKLKLEPSEAGGSTAASWLDIDVELPKPANMRVFFFGGSNNKKPSGLSLINHTGEIDLLLPPYRTILRVRSDVGRLARTKQKPASVLGETELLPEVDKVQEVRIEVEVPTTGFDPIPEAVEPAKRGSR